MKAWFGKQNPICLTRPPKRETWSEWIFYVTFWGYLFWMMCYQNSLRYADQSIYQEVMRILTPLMVLCLLNILFLSDYSIAELLLFVILSAAAYVIQLHGGNKYMLIILLMTFSGRYAKRRTLLWGTLILSALMIAATILLYYSGFLLSMGITRDEVIRPDLGFGHPNTLSNYLAALCMLWMCLRFDKFRILDSLAMIAAALFIYFVPNSRGPAVVVASIGVLVPIFRHLLPALRKSVVFRALLYLIYPFFGGLSMVLGATFSWSKPNYVLFDRLLSNRIAYIYLTLQDYKVPLWGQKLKMMGQIKAKQTNSWGIILDNGYARVLLQSGIVCSILLLLAIWLLIWWSLREQQDGLLLAICLVSVWALLENLLLKHSYNIPLIMLPLAYQDLRRMIMKRQQGAGPEAGPESESKSDAESDA